MKKFRLKESDIAEYYASTIANADRRPLPFGNPDKQKEVEIILSERSKTSAGVADNTYVLIKDKTRADAILSASETVGDVVKKVAAQMRQEDRLI